MTEKELQNSYSYYEELPDDAPKIKPCKNDPDSYIKTKEDYTALSEKYFVVWLAEKRFFEADSLVMQRNIVSEIAGLLLYISDHLILDQCIEQLSKLHGRTKFWRDAVTQARGESRRMKDTASPLDARQKEIEDLRQAGLFIKDNCYYTVGSEEEDPVMVSNFIMTLMFHISI